MSYIRTEFSQRLLLVALWGAITAILTSVHFFYALLLVIPLVGLYGFRPRFYLAGAFALFSFFIPTGFHKFSPTPKFPFIGEVVSPPAHGPKSALFIVSNGTVRYDAIWVHAKNVNLGDEVKILKAKSLGSDAESGNLNKLRIDPTDAKIIGHGSLWLEKLTQWHDDLVQFTNDHLRPHAAMTVNALILQQPSQLSAKYKKSLISSGVIFLVTISGIHIFILASIFQWFLPKDYIPRPYRIALLTCFLFVVAAMSGFHAAAIRAIIAVIGREIAYFYRREPDSLSLLAFGGLVYLGWRPDACFEPGFQLSMLAVGLLASSEVPNIRSEILQMTRVGALGWLGSAPIGAFWFGTISYAGVITGTLLSAVLMPLIALFFIAAVSSWVPLTGSMLSTVLFDGLNHFGDLIYHIVNGISHLPFVSEAWSPSAGLVALIYIALFLIFWVHHRREAPKRIPQ